MTARARLFVDISPWRPQRPSCWALLASAGAPWIGAAVKISEGATPYPGWFPAHWRAIRAAGGERYGVDWFRLGYHFWTRRVSPAAQAHTIARELAGAGPLGAGDILALDVEASDANAGASAAEVVDSVTALAEVVRAAIGVGLLVLYGGSWLSDLGVTSRLGCDLLWYARYTASLPPACYERIGWSADRLFAWQYAGAANGVVHAELAGHPSTTPIGPTDISKVMLPSLAQLRSGLWAERPG